MKTKNGYTIFIFKKVFWIFLLLSYSPQINADCSTGGGVYCSDQRMVSICQNPNFYIENFALLCEDNYDLYYPYPNGKEIFYDVTILQDTKATSPPEEIIVTVGDISEPMAIYFAEPCNPFEGSQIFDYHIIHPDSLNGLCQTTFIFDIPFPSAVSNYLIVTEGIGTYNIQFSGMTGKSFTFPCNKGKLQLEDISLCGMTPFKSSDPNFELCLNNRIISTDSLLTFPINRINQLCIRTNLKNDFGIEGLRAIDFNFGPSLIAMPTLPDCNENALILPLGETLPPQNGGIGFWEYSSFGAPTDGEFMPSVLLSERHTWVFKSIGNKGDIDLCQYNCAIYEFCFDIVAIDNEPDNTKIVGVYYPDNYSAPNGEREYGCPVLCICRQGCYLEAFGANLPNDPIVIDFEDPAMPVELLYFKAEYIRDNVQLSWATATEVNNSHFEIERSLTNDHWESIARIEGNNTSTKVIQYNFIDKNTNIGTYYYRLKQIDYDGQFEYSSIRVVELKKVPRIKITPNPIINYGLIQFELEKTIDITFNLFDLSGRQILSQSYYPVKSGQQEIQFPVDDLSNGIYFLQIQSDDFTTSEKIIIQKR